MIIIGEESIDDVAARYASFGPPLTLQFMLLSAVIGVALAIGSASVVAAVERRPRAAELNALRIQGAPARVVRRMAVRGVPHPHRRLPPHRGAARRAHQHVHR